MNFESDTHKPKNDDHFHKNAILVQHIQILNQNEKNHKNDSFHCSRKNQCTMYIALHHVEAGVCYLLFLLLTSPI